MIEGEKERKQIIIAILTLSLAISLILGTFITGAFAEVPGLAGKRVLIATGFGYELELESLLRNMGATVVNIGDPKYNIPMPSLEVLETYDVYVIIAVEAYYCGAFFELVKSKGKGLLLFSCETDVLIFAGVVPDDKIVYKFDGVSDWLTSHPINEGVRQITFKRSYLPTPLKIVSSSAYPLAIENTTSPRGIEHLVLAVAETVGKGRVVAVGCRDFTHIMDQKDNALFVKNAVYWACNLNVPSFPRELPTLLSLEDTLTKLSENVTLLLRRLDEFKASLSNVPEFASIKQQLNDFQQQLNNVQNMLTQTQQENSNLKNELSQLKNWIYIATIIALGSIVIAVASLRKRK